MDLQERLDAEVWAQIMGRFVAVLAEGVRKYGGTVDNFTGDGIMALFGAPVAQEDHARRACHAAWELTRAVGEYSEELRREQGVELNVRLGLNSGEVVVGRVGDDVTLDPTALGHTVGLAQRMEAMAEPGTAYLSEHTVRLVEGWFRLRNLGPITVKGVSEPVGVHALEGAVSSPPILHRTGGIGPAPLVGRARELAVLEDALAMAQQGQAQLVGVVGEAGVGKSRLCDEFVRACAAQGVMVRRTAGVSHGRDLPLLPVLALLRDYFGIHEKDRLEQARDKIARRLLGLDPALEETLPLLFDFLEVPDPQRPAPTLAAEVRMARVFETLRRVTQRRSERETLVLLFEDLHWFDPQSEAFLERLIEPFPGSRTLVLANFRPEFSASWMRHSYYRQLPLVPLLEQAVGELLGGLLGADLSLAPLLGFVLERTGGNPFFVEEVVRALVEDGTLARTDGTYRLTRPLQDVKVPPSVQAVIAARIDRLGRRDKRVLQTAAVIGRTFAPPVLRLVSRVDEQGLTSALSALRAAEFVQEETVSPVVLYRFWHPLTQEVAYQGMLTDQRARIHAAAARAIIDHDAARLDEQAALVATHYERAGEEFEAARWHHRAALHSVGRDLSEATRRWRATMALLEPLVSTDEVLRLATIVRARLVQYGVRIGLSRAEMEEVIREGSQLAERVGDLGLVTHIAQAHATVQFAAGDLRQASATMDSVAELANRVTDIGRRVSAWMDVPVLATYVGQLPGALAAADRVVAECADDHTLGVTHWGYSALHSVLRSRADLLALAGRLDEARHQAARVLELTRTCGEREMEAWVLATYARLVGYGADVPEAAAKAARALQIAEEAGNHIFRGFALAGLATAMVATGRFNEAIAPLTTAIEDGRARGMRVEEGRLLTCLTKAHAGVGDLTRARQTADEAVQLTADQGAHVLECAARIARAQVTRAAGSQDQVAADLDAALSLVSETGAAVYEPFIRDELGRLHHDEQGLHQALRLYRQIGATGHARRLEAELPIGGWG